MSIYVVDVEADGPCPGINNMVWFGVVKIDKDHKLETTFEGKCKPIFHQWEKTEEALAVSGLTWEDTLFFPNPAETMQAFLDWINETNEGRAMFYSDNNGFDFAYINYYCWKFLGQNPFGWSSSNIGGIWKGMRKSVFEKFKFMRKTKHDHNPVNDAKGNAEALIHMKVKHGLKIKF